MANDKEKALLKFNLIWVIFLLIMVTGAAILSAYLPFILYIGFCLYVPGIVGFVLMAHLWGEIE